MDSVRIATVLSGLWQARPKEIPRHSQAASGGVLVRKLKTLSWQGNDEELTSLSVE
jgi:hypothetical protein